MAKKFKFKNGYEGVVSDFAAAILEKKGEGKIIGEVKEDTKPAKADEGKK